MKILLLGAQGQLGHELGGPLSCFATVTGVDRAEVDLASPRSLRRVVEEASPDLIVNAAAYTDVDGAESDEAGAMAVNRDAVAMLGELCRARRVGLVHVSTDFVFDGRAHEPHTEDHPTAPVNVYGRSKLAGEQALAELDAPALVLRTAWVYSLRRKSFVRTMAKLCAERETLSVVDDQIGNPTFCRDLAQAIALLLFGLRDAPHERLAGARGVYHLAGAGHCSRFELVEALRELHPGPLCATRLERCGSDAFDLPAARPLYTVLDCGRFERRFGLALPHWRDALRRALADVAP